MYEPFYGLKTKPFAIVPDPRFIYWAGPHSMAFAMLEYGIVNHAGFTVITGEIGSGKTTLIRHLLGKLPVDVNVGLLSNSQSDRGELLEWVLMAFQQDFDGHSYVGLYKKFEDYLGEQHAQGRRTVLIVDEAQNLGVKALEELRMISNVNTYDRELLQIVLSGQPQLKELLGRPELVQFAQRVSSDFHLGLLGRKDVVGYIDHRLNVAGADERLVHGGRLRPDLLRDARDAPAYQHPVRHGSDVWIRHRGASSLPRTSSRRSSTTSANMVSSRWKPRRAPILCGSGGFLLPPMANRNSFSAASPMMLWPKRRNARTANLRRERARRS